MPRRLTRAYLYRSDSSPCRIRLFGLLKSLLSPHERTKKCFIFSNLTIARSLSTNLSRPSSTKIVRRRVRGVAGLRWRDAKKIQSNRRPTERCDHCHGRGINSRIFQTTARRDGTRRSPLHLAVSKSRGGWREAQATYFFGTVRKRRPLGDQIK